MASNQTCFQWGKVPVASCSSSDSDCASLPDFDTSAVYLPRKMKVWLSHNKLTHAHSALVGTCTAVTMGWQSSLQPHKCNFSAAWGPIAACAAVPPSLYRYMCWSGQSCHGKRRMLQPWLSIASSLQLCYQHQMRSSHVQLLPRVPSIHPVDGREQKRLAPLPLPWQQLLWWLNWRAVEGIRGRDVCQAPTFHSNLQCHFSS